MTFVETSQTGIRIFFIATLMSLISCSDSGSPSGYETRSIEAGGLSLWGDNTNFGLVDTFGFNLKDRYEAEYLIGVEDGFADRVSIHVFRIKTSAVQPVKALFKENKNYFKDTDFVPLCRTNRFSETTADKETLYRSLYCIEEEPVQSECVSLRKESNHIVNKVCLYENYLQFSWEET